MTRFRTCLAAAAIAAVAVVMAPGIASAQDYPGTTPPIATPQCTLTVGFSAPALPNATVNVTLGCSSIEAGRTYTGVLRSSPVTLPPTVATANDTITFSGVRLPADWATTANHSVTVVDQATGQTLGTASFCVDRSGRIVSCSTAGAGGGTGGGTGGGGNIPRTGSDLVGPGLQIGAGLLAAGTLAVVAARRRRAAVAA